MIQLHTFGALDLRRDGEELRSVLSQPKRVALLLYIALASRSGLVRRDTLLAAFWPESDETRARNALRQALHHLRRSLGEEVIVNRGEQEIGIDPGAFWCDAHAFREAHAAGQLEAALDLYRGEFLPGFHVDDAPGVERMVDTLRDEFRIAAARAAEELIDRHERAGDLHKAAAWARRASMISPYAEAPVRQLLLLLDEAGEAAAAQEAFRQFELRLRMDMDLEPSPETVRLAEQIRDRAARRGSQAVPPSSAQTPSATPSLPPQAGRAEGAAAGPDNGAATAAYSDIFPDRLAAAPALPDSTPTRNSPGNWARRAGWVLAAAASIVLLTSVLVRGDDAATKSSEPRSIAVLPFTNMTGDDSHEAFADGISEELLNVLTRIPELKVAARTSSFAFKAKQAAVDSIARVLGVSHVLEGSIRQSGDRVRITAQLIEASSGFHLWSDTYDREIDDVLDVQDEIAQAIVKALELQLRQPYWGADDETNNPEAYRLLVRALQVFRTPGRETYAEAAMLLEEAIRRDDEYARAWGALAHVRVWQANFRYLPPDSAFADARRLAEKSLSVRETPEAYLALARLAEVEQWQPEVADQHMRRALELNPGDARAIQFRGMLLARMGRIDEGLALMRRATELDPLHPGAFSNLGAVLFSVDRMDEALTAFSRALELSPDDPLVLQNVANVHAELGNHALALDALNRALLRMPDDLNLKGLRAYVQIRARQRAAALASLEELERINHFPRYRLAVLYSNLDSGSSADAAVNRILTLLEQAADRREEDIASLPGGTEFQQLRSHPRMQALIQRMKAAATATSR